MDALRNRANQQPGESSVAASSLRPDALNPHLLDVVLRRVRIGALLRPFIHLPQTCHSAGPHDAAGYCGEGNEAALPFVIRTMVQLA